MNEEKAEIIRAKYDTLMLLKGSLLGRDIYRLLEDIDSKAVAKAMLGKTPIDTNSYLESRGEMRTTAKVRALFADLEKDNQKAIAFLAELNAKRNAA